MEKKKKGLDKPMDKRLVIVRTVDHARCSFEGISSWDPCYDLLCIMPPLFHRKILLLCLSFFNCSSFFPAYRISFRDAELFDI